MTEASTRPVATIHLDAIVANWRDLHRNGAETSAVVKADAYGHGMLPVSQALAHAGCNTFFVAHADEALALQAELSTGIRILVLNGTSDGQTLHALKANGITPIINSLEQLSAALACGTAELALKFDTGMNRLGLRLDQLSEILSALNGRQPNLILSHLACADEPDHPLNPVQLDRFRTIASHFPGVPRSLSNSAGIHLGAEYHFELTRPGIALYGGGEFGLRPGMTLEASIVSVFTARAGESVGYGASHTLDSDRKLATLAVGYGDGLPRSLSGRGHVVINGESCPILGRVSMDLITVDVSRLTGVAPGLDRAEIFGPNLSVSSQAKAANTIDYELTTGLTPRVKRTYLTSDRQADQKDARP